MSNDQYQYDQQYQARPSAHRTSHSAPTSSMAITGLVLGVIALLSSVIPIVNNLSFFLGLLGAVFALVGIVATLRGTRRGKGLALAAFVVNVLACVAVVAIQGAYVDALNQATNGPAVTSVSASGQVQSQQGQQSSSDLAIGSSVTLANGLVVTVDYVDSSRTNYDGSQITAVGVTYTNGGSSEASFNMYDWKGQDLQGAQRTGTFYMGDGGNSLSSGTLAAGGTVSGEVYFDGSLSKVIYYASLIGDPTASWVVA